MQLSLKKLSLKYFHIDPESTQSAIKIDLWSPANVKLFTLDLVYDPQYGMVQKELKQVQIRLAQNFTQEKVVTQSRI